MNTLKGLIAVSATMMLLQGCKPYEDEIEAAKRAKEKAEQTLKDEKEAVKDIYKDKP
jgi:hypothetical protein